MKILAEDIRRILQALGNGENLFLDNQYNWQTFAKNIARLYDDKDDINSTTTPSFIKLLYAFEPFLEFLTSTDGTNFEYDWGKNPFYQKPKDK